MTTLRVWFLVIFVCLVFVTMFIHILKDNERTLQGTKRRETNAQLGSNREFQMEWETVQQRRMEKIRWKCFSESDRKQKSQKKPNISMLYFAHNVHLAFCKIPKCGSTFWMQFLLLTSNKKPKDKLFGQKRLDMHTFSNKMKEPASHLRKDYMIFMMARNPYGRLYSAYVDKIYLPLFSKVSSNIATKHNKTCGKNVTFEEFLLFMVEEARIGRTLDPHWRSLYTSCNPCHIPYTVVAKQETFSNDADYIMNKINISEYIRTTLSSALHKQHTNYSIQEITRVMISSASSFQSQKLFCHSFMEFCQRLWQSFCIQGYIRNTFSFPLEKFSGLTYTNVNEIISIYLEYASTSVISEQDRATQRQWYLHRAYKGISESTLQTIKDLYRLDFELFGYDSQPPGYNAINSQ